MTWSESDADALARSLIMARETGARVATRDVALPPDVTAALDVQARVAASLGGPVLGWKAGVRPDVGAVAAPLVPFIAGDGGEVRVPWHARLGVEVEIGFRLAHDIHVEPGRTWRRDDLLDHIDHALLGIELTGGRLADAGAAPFTLFVADSMENAGYVAGPPLGLAMLARVAQGAVSLSLRGPVQWDGIARHPQGDPLEPLLDFANARLLHLGGLKAGQIVTTGALCGLLPVSGPGHLDVCIDGAAAMRLTFVA